MLKNGEATPVPPFMNVFTAWRYASTVYAIVEYLCVCVCHMPVL